MLLSSAQINLAKLAVFHLISRQFLLGFIWSGLNRCMKQKDKLSHKQFQIIRREHLSTQEVDKWIRTASLNTETFSTTPVQLLQAQALTHTLLTQHQDLLTQSQQQALRHFQQLMAHKNTRSKLKPEATYPVFNISSKINRQLFKQHRQLTQA